MSRIMRRTPVIFALAFLAAGSAARAAECPGNPEAIGTSRTIVVDPREHARIGTMQYGETLPLADKEVVLTFDDGPLPPYTNRVLDILAAECVKATYFIVGKMAKGYPDMVRRVHGAGHTIGTHSQTHPFTFNKMPLAKAVQEIDDGIAATAAALGDPAAVAPFFRIPGLLRAEQVETYLASHAIMTWSADFPADDWRKIKASEIIRRALERLEAKGKGILLLHDIQPATAIALPGLLKELKQRGYRIVHVVPAGADRQKTPTDPAQWVLRGGNGDAQARMTAIHIMGNDGEEPGVNAGFGLIGTAAAGPMAKQPATVTPTEPTPRQWPLTFTMSLPKSGIP
jgi:peptidoglycan/xylan/chitin deacetylase (PgdA/CDA1 family)